MRSRLGLLAALSLFAGGCDEPVDPSDAGRQLDASTDAAHDAGPCGTCSGDTPLCRDDGECVSCLSNDDCDAAAPLCDDAGECASCLSDTDCSNPSPVCREGTCTGCTAHADCAERSDAPSCDASGTCQRG